MNANRHKLVRQTGCRRGFGAVCASMCFVFAGMPAQGVSLRVGVVRGFPGNTVEVPVSLYYRSNELRNVVALQADVLFDASGVTGSSPSSGTILSRHVLASSTPSSGVRRLLVYSLENAALTNGVVAHLPFTVGPNEFRNFSLTLSNVILVQADAAQTPVTNANGFVGVNQVFVGPDGHADGFLNVASNEVEQCYVVQATTDFASWVSVFTNNTTGPLLEFREEDVTFHSHRFYRALLCDDLGEPGMGAAERLDGRNRFELIGAPTQSYIFQAPANQAHWENPNGSPSRNVIRFTEPGLTNRTHRFPRVRERRGSGLHRRQQREALQRKSQR